MTTFDWRHRASCRPGTGVDPEIFFPVSTKPEFAQGALAVCSACPVRDECLSMALDEGIDDGIWGGLTEQGRRLLRLERVAA